MSRNYIGFVVSSTMKVDEDAPLTYSKTRSIFSTEERIRQTIYTLHSIKALGYWSSIYLVDSSQGLDQEVYDNLQTIFGHDLVIYRPPDHIAEVVNRHPNKTHAESLLLNNFYASNKQELRNNSYVFKTTGRYFYSDLDFNADLEDKMFFFKKPLEFKWNDNWRYDFVDLRKEQGDDMLRQYSSIMYGFNPATALAQMIDINETIMHITNNPTTQHFDAETLLYFLTRPYAQHIHECPSLKVTGWTGTGGTLLHY